jgi:hypothetical protein
MGYIGNTNSVQNFTPAVDYFNGNGSTTSFTLSRTVGSVFDVQAFIENVPQNPSTAFTVAGNVIRFDSAPPSGTNNIYVRYTSPVVQTVKPAPGTISNTEISSAFSLWNLSGANINYTAGNVGIGTSSPGSGIRLDVLGGEIRAGRVDSSFEGGQISFSRSSDNATAWYLDVYGNTSTPSLRVVDVSSSAVRATFDSSGNFQFNSGYGSVTTAYGCRAWVNFDGTGTPAIRSSGNVSSITDYGEMYYGINFSTAMPDANYAWFANGSNVNNDAGTNFTGWTTTTPGNNQNANALNIRGLNIYASGANQSGDCALVTVAIFR